MEDYEYKECYYSAKEKAELIRRTMQNLNYTPYNPNIGYMIDDVLKFANKGLGLKIKKYGKFQSVAREILSGTLFIDPDSEKALISYNNLMPANRQNFTKLHELVHWIQYTSGEVQNSQYSDLLKRKGYDEKMMPEEIEANYGASLLFCSSTTLRYLIFDDTPFSRIAANLKMSQSALKIRLINFLTFEKEIPHFMADKIVTDFSDNANHAEIKLALLDNDDDPDRLDMLQYVYEGRQYTEDFQINYKSSDDSEKHHEIHII